MFQHRTIIYHYVLELWFTLSYDCHTILYIGICKKKKNVGSGNILTAFAALNQTCSQKQHRKIRRRIEKRVRKSTTQNILYLCEYAA